MSHIQSLPYGKIIPFPITFLNASNKFFSKKKTVKMSPFRGPWGHFLQKSVQYYNSLMDASENRRGVNIQYWIDVVCLLFLSLKGDDIFLLILVFPVIVVFLDSWQVAEHFCHNVPSLDLFLVVRPKDELLDAVPVAFSKKSMGHADEAFFLTEFSFLSLLF